MHRRGAKRATPATRRRTKIEIMQAGRAKKLGRISNTLSLRYLKLIYLKRYVGGLVHFDGSTSIYRAGSDGPFGH
jgi:hypothetical protein